jgi:uncharacterized protein (TIGR02246 family)
MKSFLARTAAAFLSLTLAFCFCVLAAAGPHEKAPSPDDSKAIEEVLLVDQQRADALVNNDTAALERILADDCTYVHPNGRFETKEEVLAGLKAHDRTYVSIEREGVKVKLVGNTAIVTGRNSLKAKYQGKDYNVQNRFLRVYVKRDGRWQMVAHQATSIKE